MHSISKIGAIARCVPDDAYFNFINFLFETQKEWLNDNYIKHIRQNAQLTGADADLVENCLSNEDLHQALAQRQAAASETHGVNATPTLVINDSVKLSGLSPYKDIKRALDKALENANR